MKVQNNRFTLAIVAASLLIGSSIMAYFNLISPPVEIPDVTKVLEKSVTPPTPPETPPVNETAPSHNIEAPPSEKHLSADSTPNLPTIKPTTPEFADSIQTPIETKTEIDEKFAPLRTVLESSKLSPSMFVFNTLPFDAPFAEFPLVLVGQRD